MEHNIDILITLPFDDDLLSPLRAVSPRLNLHVVRAAQPEEVPIEQWAVTEVLYTSRVIPAPEIVPNLRWIQFHWAGINHVADNPLLHQSGIRATTLSGAATSQIAEYILMMILSLGHRLPDLFEHQRRAEWPKDRWERFSPRELRDATVGIIGYGSIGRQVAHLLRSFGATVLATKRDAMHPADPGFFTPGFGDPAGNYVHRLYPATALRSMVKECDFVVVAVPLIPANRNLVDASVFAVMKPSAFLIDISRGGIVDHTALLQALKDHHLAGAALDVFPDEPLPNDHPLWKMPNVIVTPHISGNTPWYDQRAIELFAENLRRYLTGEPLLNLFDPALGY